MIKKIINKKIQTLSSQDIKNFAINNNVNISDIEISFLLNYAKTHSDLIFSDLDIILNQVELDFDEILYLKIKPLIIQYHQKYKNYL